MEENKKYNMEGIDTSAFVEIPEPKEYNTEGIDTSAFMEESPQNEIPNDTIDLNITPIAGNYVLQRGVVPAAKALVKKSVGKDVVDVYDYAKKGKSVYDKALPENFTKKVTEATEKLSIDLAKIRKQSGEAIDKLRKKAIASGIRIKSDDILPDLMSVVDNPDLPFEAKELKSLLETDGFSKNVKVGEKSSIIRPKKLTEISSPDELRKTLQDQMDEYSFLKNKQGIDTVSSPISEEQGRLFSTIDDIPTETPAPSAKLGSIKVSAENDVSDISKKLDEYKKLSLNRGNTLHFGKPEIVNGNLIFPTTEVSVNIPKTSGSSKVFSEKIPYGAFNPIEVKVEPEIQRIINESLSPDDAKALIDKLNITSKPALTSKELDFNRKSQEALKILRQREDLMIPNMGKQQTIYGDLGKDFEDILPGITDYKTKIVDSVKNPPLSVNPDSIIPNAGLEGSGVTKKFTVADPTVNKMKAIILDQAEQGLKATDVTNNTLREKANALQTLMQNVDESGNLIPNVLEPIDALKEDAERLALLKRVGGDTVDAGEAAADVVTKSRSPNAALRYAGKFGDIVGTFAKNNPTLMKGVKGLGKSLGVIAPAISAKMLRDEALDAGLTEEEALAYSAALTGVDTAATGAGLLTTATGVGAIPGIAASLSPLVREARKMWNPESAKDKLELFKQYKAKGDSTTVAMAKLAADQAGETAMAIPGTISDIGSALVPSQEKADKYIESKSAFAGWGNKPKVNPNDSFLQRMEKTQLTLPGMSPNKNYSNDKLSQALQAIESDPKPWMNNFKESLQRALNTENKQERGRELFNLQSQPAFGAMMKKFNIEADE